MMPDGSITKPEPREGRSRDEFGCPIEPSTSPGTSGGAAYGKSAMAFLVYLRPSPRNAIFCRLSDADSAAAEFFDAGRALGIFSGGRIRHRCIRQLALGLHGAPAA